MQEQFRDFGGNRGRLGTNTNVQTYSPAHTCTGVQYCSARYKLYRLTVVKSIDKQCRFAYSDYAQY